eukprot:4688961-Prymnesium_polylepis.1
MSRRPRILVSPAASVRPPVRSPMGRRWQTHASDSSSASVAAASDGSPDGSAAGAGGSAARRRVTAIEQASSKRLRDQLCVENRSCGTLSETGSWPMAPGGGVGRHAALRCLWHEIYKSP